MRPPILAGRARPAGDRSTRHQERGQVLAIFAIALVAIVAMVGLVLDVGSTTVLRRNFQNAADAAAMAGAYSYTNYNNATTAIADARAAAAANGYTHGVGGVVVSVTVAPGAPSYVTASITGPHRNNFAGIVGLNSWNVTTTATALTGRPNAAYGLLPIIFNRKAFDQNGAGPANETTFGEPGSGNQAVPQNATTFNWTVFCVAGGGTGCNADSSTVDSLIKGGGAPEVIKLQDELSPLNAGAHTTLFSDMTLHVGKEFPVPVVDDAGTMVGFAMFHLTGAVGGSSKSITGYFVSPYNGSNLGWADQGGTAVATFGAYVVKLTN